MALSSTHSNVLITSSAAHGLLCFPSRLTNSAAASTLSTLLRVHCSPSSPAGVPLLCRAQTHLQIRQHAATAASSSAIDAASYTSIRSDTLGIWDTHPGLLRDHAPHEHTGLLFEDDEQALFLAAELRLLANAASDRAEMHSILAQQRDNWNKLFQRMLTAASMSACVLSGLNGFAHSLSLGLPALLLNAGSAAMMAIINQFQPSQLAEEQRTAVRLFRKLAADIDYALHVAPHLRQHTPMFLSDCKRRLQALDKAFPMPLTPGGLEKFPAKVVPPNLIEPQAMPLSSNNDDDRSLFSTGIHYNNGWDKPLVSDLQRLAALLDRSDIPKYTSWVQNVVKVNKYLAVAAPVLAASAAMLNALVISATAPPNILGTCAAVCSVLAAFASSFSNDMQLGMVFELYRNSTGYYTDVKTLIEETLRMPIEQRENGTLFRQRIAYKLGRTPTDCISIVSSCTATNASMSPLVPRDAKEAGILF